MSHARPMVETNPSGVEVDASVLVECIEACFDCAQSCTACAECWSLRILRSHQRKGTRLELLLVDGSFATGRAYE